MDILYFAWVRERIGHGSERLTPPAETETVAALVDWLAAQDAAHAAAFADRTRLRYALDGRFVAGDAALAGAKELAIFPPVTGG